MEQKYSYGTTLVLLLCSKACLCVDAPHADLWKLVVRFGRCQGVHFTMVALNQPQWKYFYYSSVQFSRSVVSDSLRPHESRHARPPCPSPTPGDHSDSRPSSQWCHPAISSSVVPFSSCPQSLPASESFPMSQQLFAWGGQSTGVSALASFLPKKSWGWSPSEWTKLTIPHPFWDRPHSAYRMCISLNKLAFTLLWLSLEFFLCKAKDALLVACSRDSPKTWGMTAFSPFFCNRSSLSRISGLAHLAPWLWFCETLSREASCTYTDYWPIRLWANKWVLF